MHKIAFYGKGGTGKSTVVSNLSVCLAESGHRVLQIGCDPKHDSTRGLLNGKRPDTAVELMVKKTISQITIDDLVTEGYAGVDCIEVGGPEPGAGCAGLGIIKTFELIRNLKILDRPYDYVLFDVLGDVVCGGFATPMRMEFAQCVYVVLSSEMMSMYAANNICRGIMRFAKKGNVRLGGFIGNQRNHDFSTKTLSLFAHRLSTDIIQVIPCDTTISQSERIRKTVVEYSPDCVSSRAFRELAVRIEEGGPGTIPTPMDDIGFEDFFRLSGK